jgi:hypothetical protein
MAQGKIFWHCSRHARAERMRAYAIGPRVGNVRNDEPSILEPLEGVGP